LPAGHGIAGWVMEKGQAALVHDTTDDARFWNQADTLTGYSTRSVVAVPIEFRGTRLGVAEAINQRTGSFTERDQGLLTTLASSAAIAIENARLYQVEREQRQRLQESQARLVHAEKMSALGRLVASLTHEINNPLQAVQSGLYVMSEGLTDQLSRDELIEDVRLIENEVKRIANLMQRLREFSRPVRLESRPTDLHALLDNLLELMGKQLQIQRIQLDKHWDSQLPVLIVNADLLTQVFMNLLINAIDAMPKGGTVTISTLLDRAAETPGIKIEVVDTGIGIAADVLQHIFEPFVTTKPNGVGLGLAISYEIIQSLGGEIAASSQPDVGTTFTVRLPLPALK
jgi:two-component system NtrC family sensor kinase